MPRVLIEGYTLEEALAFPAEQIDAFVLCGQPVVLRVGSAEILGEFRATAESLVIELAHVDGGGEGVLPAIWRFGRAYASKRGNTRVEWIVHAVHCANPNLKLRRVLERRGYVVRDLPGIGKAFYLAEEIHELKQDGGCGIGAYLPAA